MSFPGRKAGHLDSCFCYDASIRKELANTIPDEWPRSDEIDPHGVARGTTDADYTASRHDHESWEPRRSGTSDGDNCTLDEPWYINDSRNPEDPDKYAFDDDDPDFEAEDDDDEE